MVQQQEPEIPEFKLLLLGDGCVGKTAFVHRHMTSQFLTPYIPSRGIDIHHLSFATNKGPIRFEVWDFPGIGLRPGGPQLQWYEGAHCAIIMFDVMARITYKSVPDWYRDVKHFDRNIHVVLCGNKVDVRDRKVKAKQITFHRKKNEQYYDISVRRGFNVDKPFRYLTRRLVPHCQIISLEQVLGHRG